jgi:acetyl esterase/lipase
MKANASCYGVDPERIVLGGGSAGGHLALLAGYAPQHPELTPEDLRSADLSVCGVISYYGPTDLLALYEHTNQQRLADLPPAPLDPDSVKSMGPADWRMDILLGGWPQGAPSTWQVASPDTHVHPGCPPTLLIQGNQDLITPVDATRALYAKLVASGVPAINVVFPWTDHGFDVLLPPQINPAAQSALYDVDRFLAILLNKE